MDIANKQGHMQIAEYLQEDVSIYYSQKICTASFELEVACLIPRLLLRKSPVSSVIKVFCFISKHIYSTSTVQV